MCCCLHAHRSRYRDTTSSYRHHDYGGGMRHDDDYYGHQPPSMSMPHDGGVGGGVVAYGSEYDNAGHGRFDRDRSQPPPPSYHSLAYAK